MKTKFKFLLPVLYALIYLPFTTQAQSTRDEQSVDSLYINFRKYWSHTDINSLQSLYAEDAKFLVFDGKIGMKKKDWVPGIDSFFSEVRKTGDSIDVIFQIESREISGDLICDVGYFLSTRAGNKNEKSCGKMVNVFRKIKDAKGHTSWKFIVDCSSAAPTSEYVGTETLLKKTP